MSIKKQELFKKLESTLKHYEKKFPNAFELADKAREQYASNWHKSIFIPSSEFWSLSVGWKELSNQHQKEAEKWNEETNGEYGKCDSYLNVRYYSFDKLIVNNHYQEFHSYDFDRLAGLTAWRTTKNVFMFDDTLLNSLLSTPAPNSLPMDLLFNVIDWAYFVYMPNQYFFGIKIIGFLCFFDEEDVSEIHSEIENGLIKEPSRIDADKYLSKKTEKLNIMFVFENLATPFIFSILKGSDTSIKDEIYKEFQDYDYCDGSVVSYDSIEARQTVINDSIATVNNAINLMLFLLSNKNIIGESKPSIPKQIKTKKGLRFFPPDKPKIIEIGKSIGEKLRQYEAAQERKFIESGRTLRPHIRRGHWHGVWTGARNSETPQTFKYNWLPPMGVNIEGGI